MSNKMEKYNKYYSSGVWEEDQYYQQQQQQVQSMDDQEALANMFYQGFSDHVAVSTNANNVAAGSCTNLASIQKNIATNIGNNDDLNLPITSSPGRSSKRRRSRSGAQSHAQTTFLNASIKDFRALVQQHTGCQNISSYTQNKGPITLCFESSSSNLSNYDASSSVVTHPHFSTS